VTVSCPSCGCALSLVLDGAEAAPPSPWRPWREVAEETKRPPHQLRRLALDGSIDSRRGPRGVLLLRAVDVEAHYGAGPTATPGALPDGLAAALRSGRIRRGPLRSVGGAK
jgi:hypothetical protein